MYVKYLQLSRFRNYNNLFVELDKNVNVFIGDNAQGKTNVLEGIFYCGFAKSHRTSKDKELIKWDEKEALIQLYVSKSRLDKKIEVKIFKEGKKAININSIKISKISELVGVFNVVMFSPEDLRIVKDSPGNRRRFLDMELCQLDNKYYYNLVQYNKVLNERNTIIRHRSVDESMLDIYDEQLVGYGEYIIKKRIDYIDKLNRVGVNIHSEITSYKENIEFKYITQIKDLSSIKNDLRALLSKSRQKDIERHITSIGPHRDDFSISINGIDTRIFGSQGQQRTSVLTIKFASLNIIKEITGEYPVLLLDDVLSELDFMRKKYILSSIKDVQTIITCTGIEDIKSYLGESAKVFNVKDGEVVSIQE
jgi:DNA replication and repair protein RecF